MCQKKHKHHVPSWEDISLKAKAIVVQQWNDMNKCLCAVVFNRYYDVCHNTTSQWLVVKPPALSLTAEAAGPNSRHQCIRQNQKLLNVSILSIQTQSYSYGREDHWRTSWRCSKPLLPHPLNRKKTESYLTADQLLYEAHRLNVFFCKVLCFIKFN